MSGIQVMANFRFSGFILSVVLILGVALGVAGQSVPEGTCTPPLTAGFDDVSTLPGEGWVKINHSQPLGKGVWAQGNPLGYPAQTGNPNAFITVGFESGTGTATLSNWLLTPTLVLQNGDSMTFWTRTVEEINFPDRLQVRLSTNGPSTNVGTTATQVGDFTTLLLDINPTYQIAGPTSYPNVWTLYTVTVSGVPSPTAARFAFRYFVENGGPDGNNSDGIGVDTVTVNSCNAAPGISGTVTYGNVIAAPSPRFVSNVTLTGAGSPTVMATTDFPGGNYSMRGFGFGSYIVTPSKTGAVNGAITSFDAGRIALHVAGAPNPQLTASQLVVADVSGNSAVTSFDAGMIAKFAVGPPYTAPGIGSTGTWKFNPVNKSYPSVLSAFAAQNYSAFLMGEVSGNWANTGARPDGSSRSSAGGGPERGIAIDLPRLKSFAGKEVIVPVSVQDVAGKGIISYEFDLRYDPAVIQPLADPVDLIGTVSRGLFSVANAAEPGILRVVVYGPVPIGENGRLLNLRFKAVGTAGSKSPLTWKRILFDDGTPLIAATDGIITLVR
jgi:hypothetical protein